MDERNLRDIAVVIPSLDPDEHMVEFVKQLMEVGFTRIVIVDDGSSPESQQYFEKVAGYKDNVTILKHAVNQGKGRALKTAFHYLLNTYGREELVGAVTADADGQHSPEDTKRVAERMKETGSFVLGTRDFGQEDVPFKSRNGNRITTQVFKLLYGEKISDTQTGLRGVPYDFIKNCLAMQGERFEYEIVMLIEAVRSKIDIAEEKIQTIYINSNRATHFHAVKDSARIYKVIFACFLKFSGSGLLSSVIDIGCFSFLTKLLFASLEPKIAIFLGTLLARLISSFINYSMNRTVVFKDGNRMGKSVVRYYILCAGQLLCSWLLVTAVFERVSWDTTIVKMIVDTLLFFISYQIQRVWVFRKES